MDGEVLITVRDEGEGFDSRAVPDPTEPQSLLLSHGRGLHLMRALMDEVSFEEYGTVVRMRKQLPIAVSNKAGSAWLLMIESCQEPAFQKKFAS